MKTYDWIVIGGGIVGAALGYELVKQDFRVLLLDKETQRDNATQYSYGGVAYWSGTTDLTRQLCQEGREIHQNLSVILDAETDYQEVDLLLTILKTEDPQQLWEKYAQFAIIPQRLSPQEALEREPLLDDNALSGALQFPHGRIDPQKTTQAYQQAFWRQGGEIIRETVTHFHCQRNQIQGVITDKNTYFAENTVICAGGLSRSLLARLEITLPLYFTHSHQIITPPVDLSLRTLIMPANTQRFTLEAQASQVSWNQPSDRPFATILDPGAVQFADGRMILGQVSEILTNPYAIRDPATSEAQIRTQVGHILPSLQHLPGTWQHCLVAFSPNFWEIIGKIPQYESLYLFAGFTSPLIFVPPLARRFARWVSGNSPTIF